LSHLPPEDGNIQILYEDEYIIAINKPSGLLSHPNPGQETGSILNILIHMGQSLAGGEAPMRNGLIHRLDRDTSGVLLLSKSQEAYQKFQDLFRNRKVLKTYHFPSYGKFKRMQFTRTDKLGRHPIKRTTRMVDPNGRDAETRFELKQMYSQRHALWAAFPKTGRTHQIRVHAQAAGLSILGDPHYSDGNALQGLPIETNRTLLHCHQLEFTHPFHDKKVLVEAPYPEDFEKALEELKELAN
jgi:23S rRNA pseudouridine1911/1915/1917 synthase